MSASTPPVQRTHHSYDVAAVRSAFPALDSGLARFDAPGGSLTPRPVAQAVADAMTAGLCQRGSLTPHERRAEEVVSSARGAMARHLGSTPAAIAFGRSMTALAFDVARALAKDWGPGDEVVVTRLDHDADVRPWVLAAGAVGATVRWVDFDPDTWELDDVAPVLSERTRLVAVTGSSNLVGTRPDLAAVVSAAHAVGALVHVDAVHLAAHVLVDLTAIGADLLTCSPYKFCGPHLGVLTGRPDLLESLRPDKLITSPEVVPERFELGTLPYEQLAGVAAAVSFLESVGGMAVIEQHEEAMLARLLDGLAGLDRVRVHGRPARRTPTLLLAVDGLAPQAVTEHLLTHDVVAPSGTFYARTAAEHAGLGEAGGTRVGLAPYTDERDVDRLLEGLASL
ncbi:MAG: cysteine desulfurase-like protein [Nocardioides sp.]|nr:cysteine desulfurase-like protein [Nocardioides sp.]